MVYIVYIIAIIICSWFLYKTGQKHAEHKDEIKLVITGKPEQVKKAIETINEQELLK